MNTIWKTTGNTEYNGMERGESLWSQPYNTPMTDRDDNLEEKNQISSKENEFGNKIQNLNMKKINANFTKGNRPQLQGDITTEVAVIGAGLAGVLTAFLLQEQGKSVVLLERKEAGSGITKNTTAKITSQHGLIYQKLVRYKGEDRARAYAMANELAIEKFESICKQLSISCDFERLSNYIYSLDNEEKIRKEVEAARKIGLSAYFTRETSLPFQVKAAVRFDQQAQFHPIKFLDGVAAHLTIYENTKVTEVQKDGLIITEKGNVKADSVVIATHYPFINTPGYYFLRLHQEREYLAALENVNKDKPAVLNGMYLDADPQGFTFRNYQNYLILGSGKHRAGQNNPLDAYKKIEESAAKWYPEARMKYTWSNQDCMTPDGIPYIGRYSARTPNIYVATGFNKWGMTGSMAAAQIISDMICKKENECQRVFNPRRLMFSGAGVFLKDAGIITISLLSEHLRISRDKLEDIKPGSAGVIKHKGQKFGVYQDTKNEYYYVTTKCPHLGCSLEWNQNELTWDCPCHGSRFDYKGNLITNPAMRDVFDSCRVKKKR